MRGLKLPSLLALALLIAAEPGFAQTIEQRFERWFGPPVGQSGQSARPGRSAEQARPRAAAPAVTSVPTPSERPVGTGDPSVSSDNEPGAPEAETAAPDEGPDGASREAAEPFAASEADADATPNEGPEAAGLADGPEAGPDAAAAGAGAPPSAPAAAEPGAPANPEAVPTPEPRPSADPAPAPDPASMTPVEGADGEAVGRPDASDEADRPTAEEPADPSAPGDSGSQADAPGDDPADAEHAPEPEPAPAYVPPENARTSPEESAPETPDFEVTPEESVDAARAIEDARECEAELEARGAEFTVAASLSEGQCGVLRPVALTRTSSGVAVAPGTQMLCRTALAFDIWIAEGVAPAARAELGTDAPTAIRQASTYVCRDRASETGISEHGRGSAIDIGGFEWDGRDPIAVEEQAPGSPEDRFLASIRRAACGPFQTVIGPGTDADHSDHFHLDIAARSNGSTYCR